MTTILLCQQHINGTCYCLINSAYAFKLQKLSRPTISHFVFENLMNEVFKNKITMRKRPDGSKKIVRIK